MCKKYSWVGVGRECSDFVGLVWLGLVWLDLIWFGLGLSSWRNLTEDWVSREDWEDTVDNLLPGTEYQIRLFVKNSQTG